MIYALLTLPIEENLCICREMQSENSRIILQGWSMQQLNSVELDYLQVEKRSGLFSIRWLTRSCKFEVLTFHCIWASHNSGDCVFNLYGCKKFSWESRIDAFLSSTTVQTWVEVWCGRLTPRKNNLTLSWCRKLKNITSLK